MTPAPVLFIGGMDSSGGAGVLRDTATAQQLGADYRVAVTSVTAQSDQRVTAVHPVPVAVIAAQMALATEARLGATKIGMLGTSAAVGMVAEYLPDLPVVLDPVLRSSSGQALLEPQGIKVMLEQLLPRVTLLTPNLPELAVLAAAMEIVTQDQDACVQALLDRGCSGVLVKGGHAETATLCEDRLYLATGLQRRFSAKRSPITLRGTGCQLASAIAVHLARGLGLVEAVAKGKAMMTQRFRDASLTAPTLRRAKPLPLR